MGVQREIVKRKKGTECRISGQLLIYWNDIRKGNPFPSIDDLKQEELEDIWPDCFLIELVQQGSETKFVRKHVGANISKVFQNDVGQDVLDGIREKMESMYIKVADGKTPLMELGSFLNLNGEEVKYRKIMFPLGLDGNIVTHILGGVRYKAFTDDD